MSNRTRLVLSLALALALSLALACTETTVLPTELPPPAVTIVDCNANPLHVDCQPVDPGQSIDVNGAWTGIIADQGAAFVATVWNGSLTQDGASFSGSWSAATGIVGTLNGAIEDSGRLSGSFIYTDAAGTCSGRLDGTASSSRLDFLVTGIVGACAPAPTAVSVGAGR